MRLAAINEYNDDFLNSCNDIFELLDFSTKAQIINLAVSKNYIDNTLTVSKEQLKEIVSGIYSLMQSYNPPTLVPAINFLDEKSITLWSNETYKWHVACGNIPVTIELTHNLATSQDVFKIFLSNLSKPLIINKPTFFYTDETVLTVGVLNNIPHLMISSREFYKLPSGELIFVDTQNLNLLELIPIGQLVGNVTIPDVSISSDLKIKDWDSIKDRSISLLLNTDVPLLDLPVVNSNIDKVFNDLLDKDSLSISIPNLDSNVVPKITDYVPSDIAKKFDVNLEIDSPIPFIPNLD